MNQEYTHIVFIIDESSSMSDLRHTTMEQFNNFLREQQSVPGEATLTLCKFNSKPETVFHAMPIQRVEPLVNYRPSGSTALYDAVGYQIDETGRWLNMMAENQRPGKVVFVIITDGEENCSSRYSREDVQQRLRHQQNIYNWKFLFLASNIDAQAAAAAIGVQPQAVLAISNGGTGLKRGYASFSGHLMSYRSGQSSEIAFSAQDVQAQAEAAVEDGDAALQAKLSQP